jgi:hypothetical protein
MTRNLAVVLFGLSGLGTILPLYGEQEFKKTEVTNTERVSFAPGGTIRVTHSYGDLNVAGWDRPEVEITVTKSLNRFGESKTQDQDKSRLESIRITTANASPAELTISTGVPVRAKPFTGGEDFHPESLVLPSAKKSGVSLEYDIHVPRDSKLVIQHGTGSVSVTGVTGDLEATCGRGDILLWLLPGSYSIDAKVKFGHVSSDLEGAALNQYLIGQRFDRTNPALSHRLHLRMGFGGITIKETQPEAIGPVAVNAN